MIVHRTVYNIKKGRTPEAADLIKSMKDYGIPKPPHACRVYRPRGGPRDELVVEMEFDTLAQYEEYMEGFWDASGAGDLLKKWLKVAVRGGVQEFWRVEAVSWD